MARSNTITKFLQDIVDDSKELVDDLIERAQDAEDSVRDAIKDQVEDDETSKDDVAGLQSALAELSAKVDKLQKVSK
jgi:polyhydroxyalkanoate synthesis regulator phasin